MADEISLQITKTKIPVHPNGQNKDYGYVEFGNDEDLQAALSNNAGVRLSSLSYFSLLTQ